MNMITQIFNLNNIFIFIAQSIFTIWIINFLNNKIFSNLHTIYRAEQKIHKGFVSRSGGLTIVFSFIVFYLLSNDENFIGFILIACLPIILVGFLEDFFNNIRPSVRLNATLFSSFLLIQFPGLSLPMIDLPLLSYFFQMFPITLIFFLILSMTALANSINMIDGSNGLMLASVAIIIFCLIGISIDVNDEQLITFYSFFLTSILALLFFNFPFQKIFTGDMGAYVIGLILGFSIIFLYGRYPEHITWEVGLVLFYPIYELLFTMFRRKFFNNSNITTADDKHLHQLIFYSLKNYFNNRTANNLVLILIFPLILLPFLIMYTYDFSMEFQQVISSMIVLSFLYNLYYWFFYTKNR